MTDCLRNRLLVRIHLLIREYALINSIDEIQAKKYLKAKFEMPSESFADLSEKELAKVVNRINHLMTDEL